MAQDKQDAWDTYFPEAPPKYERVTGTIIRLRTLRVKIAGNRDFMYEYLHVGYLNAHQRLMRRD
jgi:hypothetical protein